jgi:predicted metal-dependent hydrolase
VVERQGYNFLTIKEEDMSNVFEREEEYLEDQLADGEITTKEFNREMLELRRSYQAEAEEAAQNAYDDVMGDW